ncbi:magnesium and cobalt transport protein CorA [Corynebacterium felinum]|uniref:Magnesium transporter n=1 Tax=Corynebacterium felinum TaxID=131318 RepID=A0ABU2BAJ1_9CORY|nr:MULTISPECIES: magnesium and cobalt transport protein CorA [Corynebacterium]MDF5819482.1 magnesium and cobalt transport protein CorA [Corynebacterium felinum]MDO4761736.1 magnesium and cobalt transport protein CorA [Corynebacterium sp.]MDR7355613.1 magnesium transporter [Corynebacterium felinum]WJY94965.1 Magnesium transport protein CorA [Corynebacterium felinum]
MPTPFQPPKKPVSADASLSQVVDHCRLFVNGKQIPGEVKHSAALGLLAERCSEEDSGFVWLSLVEPTQQQMTRVAEEFGIHPLIMEDAVTAHQRPKVERYEDQLFIVVRTVKYSGFDINEDSIARSRQIITTGEIQMVIGHGFIITIRHRTAFPDVGSRLGIEATVACGPMSVAWAVADVVVDNYNKIARELALDVDELEEEVFTPQSSFNVDQIYLLKREILEMRHAIDPLDPALRMLMAGNVDLIDPQISSYFRDVLDHEIAAKDDVASFDERLTALISAAVAKVTLQQNSDMRAISAFVGMAAVPTLIAGVYGMNFENMPELAQPYGYYTVIAVMVVLVLTMWYLFKRWNWL